MVVFASNKAMVLLVAVDRAGQTLCAAVAAYSNSPMEKKNKIERSKGKIACFCAKNSKKL
jgi:hypothetical protein